ncbi:hypothetical protein LZ92_23840 [Salmonella enterica]|nr:hypothetical protein [Salmonella enterica subsp. enterica serovar Newport]EBP1503268.1 hypothetical protein [Salmonella enterica]
MLSSARVKKLSLSRVLDRYLDTVSVHKRGKLCNLGRLVILTYSWASDPCASPPILTVSVQRYHFSE